MSLKSQFVIKLIAWATDQVPPNFDLIMDWDTFHTFWMASTGFQSCLTDCIAYQMYWIRYCRWKVWEIKSFNFPSRSVRKSCISMDICNLCWKHKWATSNSLLGSVHSVLSSQHQTCFGSNDLWSYAIWLKTRHNKFSHFYNAKDILKLRRFSINSINDDL